jgi:hypothetical protein
MDARWLTLGREEFEGEELRIWIAVARKSYDCTLERRAMLTPEFTTFDDFSAAIDELVVELERLRAEGRSQLLGSS